MAEDDVPFHEVADYIRMACTLGIDDRVWRDNDVSAGGSPFFNPRLIDFMHPLVRAPCRVWLRSPDLKPIATFPHDLHHRSHKFLSLKRRLVVIGKSEM